MELQLSHSNVCDILSTRVGQGKDNLGNAGSQGGEAAFPLGGQGPCSAKMDTLLLSKQISGEGRREAEYKMLCTLTAKGRILLKLSVICKRNTRMQRGLFQFRKKEGDTTLKRM